MSREGYIKRLGRLVGPDVVLVFQEKHGDRKFKVPTVESLYKVALKVLADRMEYDIVEPDDSDRPNIGFTKEDLTNGKFPEGSLILAAAQKVWKDAQSQDSEYQIAAQQLKDATKALKEKDGALAFSVLESRNDWEYEGFTWDSLETEESI